MRREINNHNGKLAREYLANRGERARIPFSWFIRNCAPSQQRCRAWRILKCADRIINYFYARFLVSAR